MIADCDALDTTAVSLPVPENSNFCQLSAPGSIIGVPIESSGPAFGLEIKAQINKGGQPEAPIARDGWLEFEPDQELKKVGIARIHVEEDAGKSIPTAAWVKKRRIQSILTAAESH